MSKHFQTSGGIGFLGLLTILFIALKLTKVIGWSWWWILSPILIPSCICLLVIIVIYITMFFCEVFK